ncbi:MAG: hypothetical protein WBG34_08185 [Flavobacteriales bacterium]
MSDKYRTTRVAIPYRTSVSNTSEDARVKELVITPKQALKRVK